MDDKYLNMPKDGDSVSIFGGASPEICEIKKEKPSFTRTEKIMAIAAAVFGSLFVHLVLWHTTGFLTTLFYIAVITVSVKFLNKSGFKLSAGQKCWAAVLYAFSFVFSVTANSMIKFLDVLFLLAGGAYLVYCVTADKKMFGRFMPIEMHMCVAHEPVHSMGREFSALGSTAEGTHFGRHAGAVIAGIAIAVPLTLVVGGLLVSADEGMGRMLNSILQYLNVESMCSIFWELMAAIPASGYLFGLLYSHIHKDGKTKLDDSECEQMCQRAKKLGNTVAYTAVTPICVLYVMFFISQANYFLSAFYGRLPDGYSFSEYARKGFFELFAVELINAAVIFFINFFTKKSGDKKTGVLKFYTVMISVFTLLITATALSKMALYIANYGLTQLRLYTSWFMVLTAFMFVFVIIKQFHGGLAFMKAAACTFTLMFALLCFSRPDALIAKYDLEYFSDKIDCYDVKSISRLSGDAAAVIASPEQRETVNALFNNNEEELNRMYDDILRHNNKSFYDKLNLSSVLINIRLKDIK